MVSLRQHQQSGSDFILNSNHMGALLWHGMGLGKTLTALWTARILLARLRAQGVKAPKFLVLVPKSAVSTWQTECRKFTPDIYNSMLILPYSQIVHARKILTIYDVRVLIEDESHYLKTPETQRADQYCDLLTYLDQSQGGFLGGKVIKLSGTPMLNNAGELYTSWATLGSPTLTEAAARIKDEERYRKWLGTFAKSKEKRWSSREGEQRGSTFEGVQNAELLNQLLAPVVHYRRVSDCLDLPQKSEQYIDLNLPDDKLLKDADIEKPEAYMALLERLARAKVPYMMDWVKDFFASTPKTEQLVVFSNYVTPLQELVERYKKDFVIITGAESSNERKAHLEAFQSGKKRGIALSYKAGSEALNLQNSCFTLYHGYPWTYGAVAQAMARTYRQGQPRPTWHYFLTSGENDRINLRRIRAKEEATTTVEDLLLQNTNPLPKTLDSLF